jgi:3-carboxy-cis,cis-muconate cycloisomerase
MASLIRDLASSTPAMIETFGDEALVAHALAFEAALSRAQAAEGLFEPRCAELIAEACTAPFDLDALAKAAAHAGALAIPLVAELRPRLAASHPEAAAVVHLGATSQDVADTALVLQAKAGLGYLRQDLARTGDALERRARVHAATPMLARTLLRSAAPTTFGLKIAQWRLSLLEASRRVDREAHDALVLQLGGAVGTLAGQGGRGQAVVRRVAGELGLGCPPGPWHARRDAIAALGAAVAIVTSAVAKFAGDLAELFELAHGAVAAMADVAEGLEVDIAAMARNLAAAAVGDDTGEAQALTERLLAIPWNR